MKNKKYFDIDSLSSKVKHYFKQTPMIELIIKIPKEKFRMITNKMYCGIYDSELYKAIETATILPEDCKAMKFIVDELLKMPPMVIETAYLYAKNYVMYGENVTEKWLTAIQNTSILEKAYRKGYYDALQRQKEYEEQQAEIINASVRKESEN